MFFVAVFSFVPHSDFFIFRWWPCFFRPTNWRVLLLVKWHFPQLHFMNIVYNFASACAREKERKRKSDWVQRETTVLQQLFFFCVCLHQLICTAPRIYSTDKRHAHFSFDIMYEKRRPAPAIRCWKLHIYANYYTILSIEACSAYTLPLRLSYCLKVAFFILCSSSRSERNVWEQIEWTNFCIFSTD